MRAEICVYGEAAGGTIAAVAAAREGRSVILVNPRKHLGGMSASGLGATDAGNINVIGGIAREVYRRIGKHYGDSERFTFEPHVAEGVFNDLVKEAKVTVLTGRRVAKVSKQGARITSITLDDGGVVEAGVFIDSSYEGDVMARAGVSWVVGREPVAQYGESLNGIRAETPSHQYDVPVDPYNKPGDPTSGLLPCMQEGDGGKPGDGDLKPQAYNFRLCLTRDPKIMVAITPPKDYNAGRYELLGRYCDALRKAGKKSVFSDFFLIVTMPNGKTDFNNSGGFSTDHIGESWAFPDADYATRDAIWADHVAYTRGLFHYLCTESRVPEQVRREAQTWGLCRDEFTDNGGWPFQLYVREGRRMVGQYIVTQDDCQLKKKVDDPIGMGAYTMDSHNCQRIVKAGSAHNEGDVQISVSPYPVSYRAITPKASECENLLVNVCVSASHIAHGSIRMEPVFMVLGESAGLAACAALAENKPVQAIEVPKLLARICQGGQVLEYDKSQPHASGWLHDAGVYKSEC
jgi:hypothetical protein